jgi:predicted small lipoprotein YifL
MTTKTDRRGTAARLILLTLAAGLALSACGRKGELDRPGVTPPPEQQRSSAETLAGGFSNTDATDAPPIVPQRRFILDPLLD